MSEREDEDLELDNIVVLTDDNGKDTEFEWLDTVELNDNQYIILLPVAEDDAEEVVILKMETTEEEENFIPIEDEEELNQVYDIFKERNKENFDFID